MNCRSDTASGWLWSVVAIGLLGPGTLCAETVLVVNPGFEAQAVANGFVFLGVPTGWTIYNPANINGTSDSVGLINPTGTDHFPEGAAEGQQRGGGLHGRAGDR